MPMDFSIENGVLRFENSPDFENGPADQGNDNTYEFTIQASDGGGPRHDRH